MLQKKLTSFFSMFKEVTGMQQLYKHKVLYVIFVSFLSNPDINIAQMALSCISKYKLQHVTPYKEHLQGMLSRSQMRDTLTKFKLSREDGTVDSDHRELLIPIIIRMLYGRLSARGAGTKSSKDSPAVRRAAILSFISGLSQNEHEIGYFVYMMVRCFVPESIDMHIVNCGHHSREHIKLMIEAAHPQDISGTATQRQEGFLNLMSDVVKKLGHGIINFIPTFMSLILTMIEHGERNRKLKQNGSCGMELGFAEGQQVNSKYNGKVRSLCLLRVSELMAKFASTSNFDPFVSRLWSSLQSGLDHLPSSVVNADKPPSLLILLETMSSHPDLIALLMKEKRAVKAVFNCISAHSRTKVVECALKFVDNLLTEGGTLDTGSCVDDALQKTPGKTLVMDHLELLIGQFTKRLASGSSHVEDDIQFVRSSNNNMKSQSLSRELSILCRVSELLVHEKVEHSEREEEVTLMMESLCKLLVPFLDFSVNQQWESNQSDILGILKFILPRIRKMVALSHLQSLARLLGPDRSNSGLISLEMRQKVITCIEALHEHGDDQVMKCLRKVTTSLRDLNAPHPNHIDECNFEAVLPILNGLGSTSSEDMTWIYYVSVDSAAEAGCDGFDHIKTLMPLVFSCLHMLYDQDGVVSRGALKALKELINTAKKESKNEYSDKWLKLVESNLIPRLLTGIKSKNIAVRRSFILLLAEVSFHFQSEKSPHFYGDLSRLIDHDDQVRADIIDFFLTFHAVMTTKPRRIFSFHLES